MKIIAVDDEKIALEALAGAIKAVVAEDEVISFRYPEDALDYIKENPCDIAFLDIEMAGMGGVELAEELKKYNTEINIVFCTGYGNYRDKAFDLHASGYLMKPITPEKVKHELENLRRPILEKKRLKVQTFGNFEVYLDGKPLAFKYRRTKELFAYLIDRVGALCSVGEIIGVLFEDEGGREDYFQKLRRDLLSTISDVDCEKVIVHKRGMLGVVISEVQCDYYDCLNGKKDFNTSYMGEYMSQYSFAEYTNAQLYAKFKKN
ncbi:MAG: response regulator [Clostridia bacterium]|nr:response regulator [Clostridia bacterium]